jgi:hypothetical protein
MNKLNGIGTTTVTIGRGAFGSLNPQINLEMPKGTNYRVTKAALYAIAAKVELATLNTQGWVVCIDANDTTGSVYLELLTGGPHEAEAGEALLRAVLA